VIGDASSAMQDGRPVPGVAQAGMQQGRYVGRFVAAELKGKPQTRPFHYFDKGNMAVIGKNFAILESGRLRISGLIAWFAWAIVHVVALPHKQNRARSKAMVVELLSHNLKLPTTRRNVLLRASALGDGLIDVRIALAQPTGAKSTPARHYTAKNGD
jgi:hypothetical protein